MPTFLQKQKTHLILHLVECADEFGPTSSFNAERYVYHILLLVPARPTPSPGLACLLTKDLGHIHLLNTGLSHSTQRCGCLIFSVIVKPQVGT